MIRSAAAIVCGYLIFAVTTLLLFRLTGHDPRVWPGIGFIVGITVYGVLFAFIGGYVAAALAPRRPALHAQIVATLIGAGALISVVAELATASVWSQIAALLFMVPAAAFGGVLRSRRA